jgi:antitoxin HicB
MTDPRHPAPLRHSMLIQWSDEDGAYVVTLPEWEERVFRNPVTHGDTYEEAVSNGREALEALVGWAIEQGIPSLPRGSSLPPDTASGWPSRPVPGHRNL